MDMKIFSRFLIYLLFILICLSAMNSSSVDSGEKSVLEERTEKDSAGRDWVLKDWEDGSRPYHKSLKEREAWYQKKWGEHWYGVRNGRRIHNPGNYKWEVVVTVPADLAAKIASEKLHSGVKKRNWGNRFWGMAFVWGPGGGEVTDIYALADNGIYHYDATHRTSIFIGNPEEGGLRDGLAKDARLQPGSVSLDPITGRLYFIQDKKTWRYVEKLLPYECSVAKRILYLPAVLDWNDLYRKVKSPYGGQLIPVLTDNKRAKPIFVVRTNPLLKTLYLPGAARGKRPLVTPDGKGVFFSQSDVYGKEWDTLTLYDNTALFDIETGKMLGNLKLAGEVPRNNWNGTQRWTANGPGTHGGNNIGYDGHIYTCQHGGSGGGPGRMFSIDPETGKVPMLYNSMAEDGSWSQRKSPIIDGPADAKSLDFTSTLWQVQCPRTGAIINGGWDNSGIRRYHDGFVTTIANGDEDGTPPRPGWKSQFGAFPPDDTLRFYHGNSSPSIAPNGDLYIADDNSKAPRILRIYRTDWPEEQPVNGYAEQFLSKEKMEKLMIEYAENYVRNYKEKTALVEKVLPSN
jgi:hypothetical protein